MNQFIENTKEEPLKQRKQKSSKSINVGRFVKDFLAGNMLSWDKISKAMPFLFFLTFIAILYIANSYIAQKTFKRIETFKIELKELRAKHISMKSELMIMSKQSEVAKRVAPYGLKESVIPPSVIIADE